MFDFRTVLISALAMFYRSCLRFFIVLTPLAPTSTHSTHLHIYTLHMRTVSKQPPPQFTWSRQEIISRRIVWLSFILVRRRPASRLYDQFQYMSIP